MKRLITAVLLLMLMAFSVPASAADLTGIYVAPKLLWSHQMHDGTDVNHNGWTFPNMTAYGASDKSDDTWGGALALGYDFKSKFSVPVRAELEAAVRYLSRISTRADDLTNSDTYDLKRTTNVTTVFANVFYDINTGTAFTPYVGAGLGVAFIKVRDISTEGVFSRVAYSRRELANFAWNVGAGVAYSINANWALDLGYRYSDFGQVKGGTGTETVGTAQTSAKSDLTAHEVMLGARYTF